MTSLLPELADLPAQGVFDGEIVAFSDGVPHFPLVCERLVHGDRSIPLTFVDGSIPIAYWSLCKPGR